MQTISSAVNWWANVTPGALALSIGADRISYRQLHDWSERIAASLIAGGVARGDRIGICGANSAAYCALVFGAIRAGAIVTPLNVRYTTHELAEIVDDVRPVLLFADDERAPKFSGMDVAVQSLEGVRAFMDGALARMERETHPDDPVGIIATSGSTAKPKGVVFSNRSMTSYAAATAIEEPDFVRGARTIVVAPLSTSAGLVQLIHYSVLGFTLYFEATFDPDVFLDILGREKITCFGAAPVFFERIAACAAFDSADLSSIRVATTGGSSVSRTLQDRWMTKGIVLRQIYGLTECGGNATMMPTDLAVQFPEKCGRGGAFTELGIVDAEGHRLPPGAVGEIVIRGPGLMIGYWNNPDATADVLRNGWLHTGDLGVIDENGLLTFVDRMKDIIISGGLNISAAEVERAILAFDGVEEVMVIAAKDPKFGETPMAIVYARRGINVADLITHCNARLADFKVPRYVAIEAEPMPRTPTGKLSKPIMREKYANAAEMLPRVR